MDILDLGLLIFILFYIFKNAYLSIVLFALISLILQQFSKNKLLFVLLPLLIAHLFFLYNNPQEGFKRRRRRRRRRRRPRLGKSLKKRLRQAKQETKNANNQTKIEKKQKEKEEGINSEINDIASEHV